MNKHDRANIDYILSLPDEELLVWFDSIDEDGREYALEILKMARTELTIKVYDLVETQISEMGKYKTAVKVLAKFR